MTFTVTYEGNGATGGSVPVDATAYNSADQVTVLGNTGHLSEPGGQFVSWNTADDGSGVLQAPGSKFTITGDVTLFAQWSVAEASGSALSAPVAGGGPQLPGSSDQQPAGAAGVAAASQLPGPGNGPKKGRAPELRRLRTGWWLSSIVVLLAAGCGFSLWAAVDSSFDPGHRTGAALAALPDVIALAALVHLILVSYQGGKAGILHYGSDNDREPTAQETLEFRRRGLKGAVMGQDGRASTSKTQVVAWTAAVLWALIYLLLLARTHTQASQLKEFFAGAVTSNWHPDYLVLLGLPVAAAATAKAAVTGSNAGQGPVSKSEESKQPGLDTRVYIRDPVPAGVRGFNAGIAELITSDDGTVAWSDLQYVVFTLITLVYFAAQVVAQPQDGLPAVPPALLTLMGVSASGYAAKKIIDAQGSAKPASNPAAP